MNDVEIFVNRLSKIGITVTFIGNIPWIYLDTVNSKKVKGTYLAEHGFTAFWLCKPSDGKQYQITDITEVFKKIRETLNQK